MDLFNKQKVAALEAENQLLTAKLEATSKQLEDLQTSVLNSYEVLSEYFKPKYLNKYFKLEHKYGILYFQCKDVYYSAGLLHMNIVYPLSDKKDVRIDISVSELKNLKITTKQEFLTKGESK